MRDASKRMRLFAGRARDGDGVGVGVASDSQESVSFSIDQQDQSDTGLRVATPWAESTIRNSVQEASDSLAARRKAL
jgi:hypothetical protein